MNKPDYPQHLNFPVILMCAPYWSSFNNFIPNNVLMKDGKKPDYPKAFFQWLDLYRYIASQGLVYILPNEGTFQDQVYVANLGVVIHHLNRPTVILSNFTSHPRIGEESVGRTFFSQMKYDVFKSKFLFEGEADLKYIRDNLWFGGWGIRTDIRTYDWLERDFGCKIIKFGMTDQKLYHFDCCCFPISGESVIMNTSVLNDYEIREAEKYVEIIDVPKELRYTGITNLCRVGLTIICRDLDPTGKRWLNKVCETNGFDVKYFPLESYDVGGADLSCLLMHMNKPFRPAGKSVIAGVRNFFNGNS